MSIKFQRELKFKNSKLQNLTEKLLEDGTPTIIDFKKIGDKEYNRFTDLRIFIKVNTTGYMNRYHLISEGDVLELIRNSSDFVVVDAVPEKVMSKQDGVEVPIDAYAIKIIERLKVKTEDSPSFLGGPSVGDVMYGIVSPFRNLAKSIEDSRPDWSLKPDPRFPPIKSIGQLKMNKNKEGENDND